MQTRIAPPTNSGRKARICPLFAICRRWTALPLHRVSGLFGSDDPAPYQYVEIIDINALDTFLEDVSTATMAKVAGEFRGFADSPVFMLTDAVGDGGA